MATSRLELIEGLRNPEYRKLYVSDQIRELIALQIRSMREQKRWTQAELGERAGMAQVRISVLEDPNVPGVTLRTLERLAQAFDVALIVRFAPFSEMIDWTAGLPTPGFSAETYAPKSFSEESFGEIRITNSVLGTSQGSEVSDLHVVIDTTPSGTAGGYHISPEQQSERKMVYAAA